MFSARFLSQNLSDAVCGTLRPRLLAKTKRQSVILLIFLTGMLLWITNGYNIAVLAHRIRTRLRSSCHQHNHEYQRATSIQAVSG